MNRRSRRRNPFKNEDTNHQNGQNTPQLNNNSPVAGSNNHGNRNPQQQNSPQACFKSPQNQQLNGYGNQAPYQSPQSPAPIRSGACVLCKSTTVLICSRCGDFYCSPACQMNDWQTHRYICFAMPKLVSSSVDIYQNLPVLRGYQNAELCGPQSQNLKWINDSPPVAAPAMQNNYQAQQQLTPPKLEQRQNPEKQAKQEQANKNVGNQQQQNKNRQTPPKEANNSEKSAPKKALRVGRVANSKFPESNSKVIITAVRTSNRIFIRSIEKADNDGYREVLKAINEYGVNASPLTILPDKNAYAITDFNNDNIMYRVQVVSVKSKDEIRVIYFDFGNEATKKLSDLKEINVQCATMKQYIHMVSLKDVPFVKDNPKLLEYMETFQDLDAKIVYDDPEKPNCEIIIDGDEESFNKKIKKIIKEKSEQNRASKSNTKIDEDKKKTSTDEDKDVIRAPASLVSSSVGTSRSTKSRPSQFAKPIMKPPFEEILLSVKLKNINVIVVDNSLLHFNCIGCILVEDKDNLQKIQNYLADYEDSGRAYNPKVDEYCLAKFDGGWYRAKVLEILSKDVVEVVFIDFLNEAEVNVKDIRRYTMDLELPCKTTLCMIQGLPEEMDENQVEYLKNKLQPGTELKINEVVEKLEDGSNITICKINQITQWMNADKP